MYELGDITGVAFLDVILAVIFCIGLFTTPPAIAKVFWSGVDSLSRWR